MIFNNYEFPPKLSTKKPILVFFKGKDFMVSILLLLFSNLFMTFAWYGHLKYKEEALWKVVLISWGIAFFEYCLQVPANRIGHETFSASQLKILQEVISLVVFGFFSIYYLGETLKWNTILGFILMLLSVFVVFYDWK